MIDAKDINTVVMMLKKETTPYISELYCLETIDWLLVNYFPYWRQLKFMQSSWCLGVYVTMSL